MLVRWGIVPLREIASVADGCGRSRRLQTNTTQPRVSFFLQCDWLLEDRSWKTKTKSETGPLEHMWEKKMCFLLKLSSESLDVRFDFYLECLCCSGLFAWDDNLAGGFAFRPSVFAFFVTFLRFLAAQEHFFAAVTWELGVWNGYASHWVPCIAPLIFEMSGKAFSTTFCIGDQVFRVWLVDMFWKIRSFQTVQLICWLLPALRLFCTLEDRGDLSCHPWHWLLFWTCVVNFEVWLVLAVLDMIGLFWPASSVSQAVLICFRDQQCGCDVFTWTFEISKALTMQRDGMHAFWTCFCTRK